MNHPRPLVSSGVQVEKDQKVVGQVPRLKSFRLRFSFRMGIQTSPSTTNVSPMDTHAEATERGTSAASSKRSRKRSPPTADIRDPITMTMMDLWRKAQPGVTAALESSSEGRIQVSPSTVGSIVVEIKPAAALFFHPPTCCSQAHIRLAPGLTVRSMAVCMRMMFLPPCTLTCIRPVTTPPQLRERLAELQPTC